MPVRAVDDKPSDTLVVVSGEGFWTGSSTLPHLHQLVSWLALPYEISSERKRLRLSLTALARVVLPKAERSDAAH
jgi:hypothetical protein